MISPKKSSVVYLDLCDCAVHIADIQSTNVGIEIQNKTKAGISSNMKTAFIEIKQMMLTSKI